MSPGSAPLRDLLPAVASEIEGARRLILGAERHLAAALASGALDPQARRELQDLDLALQVLEDAQGVLLALAGEAASDLTLNAQPALDRLKLGGVAARLAAALGSRSDAAPAGPSVELF